MCIYSYLGSHIGHKGKISTGYHIGYNIEGWLKIPSVHGTDRHIHTDAFIHLSKMEKDKHKNLLISLQMCIDLSIHSRWMVK